MIRRRILVNYRVDPEVLGKLLPPPFRPKLHRGAAVAGICLIRLEQIRPVAVPAVLGIASENAAHRMAVVWDDAGREREGVYIPRRDSDSLLNQLAGGRLFPGEHHRASFRVRDDGAQIELAMDSADASVSVEVRGVVDERLPDHSIFASLEEASRFFEGGSLGYSATRSCDRFDGVRLETHTWSVRPLRLERARSSYFAAPGLFPAGSAELDSALLMRDIDHEWIGAPELRSA